MLVAALAPPLVLRGAIASVDSFAALFVLAALLCGDRLLAAPEPLPWAAAGGALVGCAFASKYTAGLAAAGLVTAALAGRHPAAARARALAAGALAALAAAFLGAPATFLRASAVAGRLAQLRRSYSESSTPTLWEQAVGQASWEHRLEAPELGPMFLLVALCGLVWMLADRERARRLLPWLVYAAATLALVSRYPFQPFRNLLPLVPLLCVLAVLGLAAVARLLRLPRWTADAATVAMAAALLLPSSVAFARQQWRLADSRAEAVRFLARQSGGGRVAAHRDLAILPGELRRLGRAFEVGNWNLVARALARPRTRWLILPDRPAPEPAAAQIARRYRLVASFGEEPTSAVPGWWHGNRQKIQVFERR
jgi:4-amino-4-deoxy-L-arabinose transferase-like glycosyltransferase